MTKKHKFAGLVILLAASLLVTACSAQQPTTTSPTVDTNLIYTQAAQTVEAGAQMTQAAKPTATQTPTVQPTATMDPTIASGLTATSSAVLPGAALTPATTQAAGQTPGAAVTQQATPLVLATATKAVVSQPTAASAPTGDKCEWVSNDPADNTRIPKNATFDLVVRFKNTGTTTWTNQYALRYYAGEKMGAPSDYYVQKEVKPGETYSFRFEMKAPDSTGKKELLMVLQNPEGRTMCPFNLPLEITE